MHFRKFDIDLKIFLKENTNDAVSLTEKKHIQCDLEKPRRDYLLLLNYSHILRCKKKGKGEGHAEKGAVKEKSVSSYQLLFDLKLGVFVHLTWVGKLLLL